MVTKWKFHLALVGLFRLRINAGRAIDKINRYTAWTAPRVPLGWHSISLWSIPRHA
jgi:hypothetical protein